MALLATIANSHPILIEHRLSKFKGKTVCATYNFGGDPRSAEEILASGMAMFYNKR